MSMTPSRNTVLAYKLHHAAEQGKLIIYRCAFCKRSTAFVATDVVTIWNPDASILIAPDSCGACKKAGYMSVTVRPPGHDDVGHLIVRRPAGVRHVQLWRNEWYG
jgi:hypothetical protein